MAAGWRTTISRRVTPLVFTSAAVPPTRFLPPGLTSIVVMPARRAVATSAANG